MPPNLHAACFIVSHEQILWCFPPLFLVWSFGDQAPHTQSLQTEQTRAEQPVLASLLEETADGYHVPTRGMSFFPSSSFYPLPLASVSTFLFLFLYPFAHGFLAVPSHSLPAERRQEEETLDGTGVWGARSLSERKEGKSQSFASQSGSPGRANYFQSGVHALKGRIFLCNPVS